MASYQLTEDAEADVDGIYEYSILHFGLQQARDYVNSLQGCFGNLADNPGLGRDYSHVKANARRFEYQSHSVYYGLLTAFEKWTCDLSVKRAPSRRHVFE